MPSHGIGLESAIGHTWQFPSPGSSITAPLEVCCGRKSFVLEQGT